MKTKYLAMIVAGLMAVGCSDGALEPVGDERPETPSGETPDGDVDGVDEGGGDVDGDGDEVVVPDDTDVPDARPDCADGAARSCYSGPQGTEGVGACTAGEERCVDGAWGACTGEVTPTAENPLDGIDNDCNASVDETALADPALTGGHWHSCYLTDSQEAYCWGQNEWGQVGDGSTENRLLATRVNTSVLFDQIEAGYMFNCALSGNSAYCWGQNENGQLGDGTTDDRYTPTKVATVTAFMQVTAGDGHACGLGTDGAVSCWGANDNAQVTDPSRGATIAWPLAVTTGVRFTTITAGQLHTCGLDAEGRAWCWGYNGHKQIGIDSSEIFVPTPSLVSEELRFTQISAGYRHTCGVTMEKETWCWGDGASGQLGDGSGEDQPLPTAVAGELKMKRVFAGFFGTCGITTTDETYCWGQNWKGQVGDGTNDQRNVPTPVLTDRTFVDLAMMVTSTCGRTGQGEMSCWGENDYGQFATASPNSSTTPEVAATLP